MSKSHVVIVARMNVCKQLTLLNALLIGHTWDLFSFFHEQDYADKKT